jgi:acylphosphatase
MPKRVHVFYSGKVQGVGFRFTTLEIARDVGVAGWVKNLPDGRVEVAAEADEPVLNNFLSRIQQDLQYYIRRADVSWQQPAQGLSDFTIKF